MLGRSIKAREKKEGRDESRTSSYLGDPTLMDDDLTPTERGGRESQDDEAWEYSTRLALGMKRRGVLRSGLRFEILVGGGLESLQGWVLSGAQDCRE